MIECLVDVRASDEAFVEVANQFYGVGNLTGSQTTEKVADGDI
jgi:hypothetical protein